MQVYSEGRLILAPVQVCFTLASMLKFRVVTVGRLKEAWCRDAVAEYVRRLGRFAEVDIREVKEEECPTTLSVAARENVLVKEAGRIVEALGSFRNFVLLDREGRSMGSEQLAQWISRTTGDMGPEVGWVIGGSLGTSSDLAKKSGLRLSFGPMTFPHQLFRVMLMEQLYRAGTILQGHPYHK